MDDFELIDKRAGKEPLQFISLMTAESARKFLNSLVTSWTVYRGYTWTVSVKKCI
jgi:hypothetical protein